MKSLKVLISAYACEPDRGSEPGVGWNFAIEISNYHMVWVITRANNRPVIEAELVRKPKPNLHFVYHDLPAWAIWLKHGEHGVQLYYYLWQITGYFVAKKLQKDINFDIAHHITFGKYWSPSFLALINIPYILGPVGGAETAPLSFWPDFGVRGFLYESVRSLARFFGEIDPFVRITVRRSSVVLAKAYETERRMKLIGVKKVKVVSEVGFSQEELLMLSRFSYASTNSVRFVGIGNLSHLKGQHLALQAFAACNIKNSEYWIIGDGVEKKRLVRLVDRLGIKDKVHFWGALPRQEVLKCLSECHILVHPTLHDSGGWVALEAMALGKPVICLNLGGPATQVIESTGIKVFAVTPEQVIHDLAQSMHKLAQDPELRGQMGEMGRNRVWEEYSWKKRIQQICHYYEQAINESNPIA